MARTALDAHDSSLQFAERYTVDWSSQWGTGLGGRVFRAVSKKSSQTFAAKFLPDGTPETAKEIDVHRKCSPGPGIVTLVEVFRDAVIQLPGFALPSRYAILVLEMLQGGELFYYIKKHGAMSERECLAVIQQLLFALDHLHTLGIAHRDVKPENICLVTHATPLVVKLVDFGFSSDATAMTSVKYTPAYCPPEILHNLSCLGFPPVPYTKACDLWSLGVLMYVLLTSSVPFYSQQRAVRGRINRDMQDAIAAGRYTLVPSEWSHITPETKDLLRQLLTVDPRLRPTPRSALQHACFLPPASVPIFLPGQHSPSISPNVLANAVGNLPVNNSLTALLVTARPRASRARSVPAEAVEFQRLPVDDSCVRAASVPTSVAPMTAGLSACKVPVRVGDTAPTVGQALHLTPLRACHGNLLLARRSLKLT